MSILNQLGLKTILSGLLHIKGLAYKIGMIDEMRQPIVSDEETTVTVAIDKLRASKAGHAFHEAWAARTALELLPPSTDLTHQMNKWRLQELSATRLMN